MGRAGPTPDGSSTSAAPRGAYARALRACLLLALTAFLVELGFQASSPGALGASTLRGLLAGLGLGLVLAAALALLLGALLRAAGGDALGASVRARGAWLWQRDPELQLGRVAALLSALVLLLVGLPLAFAITRALIVSMAQPHFAATAIVAAHALLGALALLAFPVLRAACRPLAALGARPALRPLLGRAGDVLRWLAALLFGALCAVIATYWGTFTYLPWRTIAATVGAPVLVSGWLALAPRLGRAGAAAEQALLALGVVAGLGAMLGVGGAGQEARRAMRDTVVGEAGYAAALLALDFDRDGALPVLGGGDCAPFDRLIGPLAIDTPGNRIDEDCDGADLDERMLGAQVRRAYPLPEGFPQKPTIVLLTIDAFAATRMKGLGYARSVTPHIDAFARRGTFFRYGFAQGPSTRLSFPAMFTSRWDTQIAQKLVGGHPYPIDDSEQLLAELLAQSGYDTTAVISDQYFRKSRWGSLLQGFQFVKESALKHKGVHNSREVTDAALAALAKPRKKPLFLWVHYYDAHSPHQQPEELRPFGTERGDVYDGELALVDREVGRLLATIDARLEDRTLVFLTGDHGIAFDAPRHDRFNYGYDLSTPVLHVPLIVAGPQVRRQVLDSIVSTMDIAPTIANLAGVQRPTRFEGASLLPELFSGQVSRPPRLLHEFFLEERLWEQREPLEQVSLRTDQYDLIHDRRRGVFALYDWRADYYEKQNLADRPEHQRELQALKQQLALMTYRVYAHARTAQAQATAAVPGH